MTANKQIILMQAILTGIAMFAVLVLFHTAQFDDTKTVAASGSMHLVDRATDLPNLAGGFATDGDDDDEAQLQQQLAQQQMQQAEQQAEEQEQLANQQAQQAEQQGLQVEQQATLSGSAN